MTLSISSRKFVKNIRFGYSLDSGIDCEYQIVMMAVVPDSLIIARASASRESLWTGFDQYLVDLDAGGGRQGRVCQG